MSGQKDDIEQLHALLAAERATLLAADYTRLEEFAEAKSRLVMRIAEARPAQYIALELQAQLTRNAALLKAASDGFRATIQRLSSPEAIGTALYEADGSRRMVETAGHRMERKA